MLTNDQLEIGRRYQRPDGSLVVELIDLQHELRLGEPDREYAKFKIIRFKMDDNLAGVEDRCELEDFREIFRPADCQYFDHKEKLKV